LERSFIRRNLGARSSGAPILTSVGMFDLVDHQLVAKLLNVRWESVFADLRPFQLYVRLKVACVVNCFKDFDANIMAFLAQNGRNLAFPAERQTKRLLKMCLPGQ